MNQHIEVYLTELVASQRKPVLQLAKKRDDDLEKLPGERDPAVLALAAAESELVAATDFLDNLSLTAEPGEIATNQTIVFRWPDRITLLQAAVDQIDQRALDLEAEFQRGLRRLTKTADDLRWQSVLDLRNYFIDLHQFEVGGAKNEPTKQTS